MTSNDNDDDHELSEDVSKALERQLEKFRETFGRDPEEGEPIIFDPMHYDTPTAMDPDKFRAINVVSMIKAEIPHVLIYIYVRTDLIIFEDQKDNFPEDVLEEAEDAADEYDYFFGEDDGDE